MEDRFLEQDENNVPHITCCECGCILSGDAYVYDIDGDYYCEDCGREILDKSHRH